MRITAALLREHQACESQVAIFEAEWPQGGEVAEASLLRAAGLRLNLYWFAVQFLSAPLREGYKRKEAPLREGYKRKEAPLRKGYKRQQALLQAEYKRQEALLLAEYGRQQALLWEEYKRQEALLIWQLISRGEE